MKRIGPRSLRGKIVVVTLATLTAAFILVAAATVFALHRFLVQRLDQQLVAAGSRFSNHLDGPDDHDGDNAPDQIGTVAGQAAGTLGAIVRGGRVVDATIVGDGDKTATLGDEPSDVLAGLTAGGPRDAGLPGIGEYRVLAVRDPDGDGDLLITGLPKHPVNETIAELVLIEAIVFGVALVAVGLANAGFVRLTLRPLRRVAHTAKTVATLPLASGAVVLPERVPEVADAESDEVSQVSEAFNHMLDEVEAAFVAREASEDRLRRFIADASHELRTPVAVIRSHAEYAQRAGTGTDGEVTRSLGRIEAEAQRMGRLVDDLLLLARLDSGRPLAREQVDLTRIVLDCVSDVRIVAPDQHWQLALPPEPVVLTGDDHALRQVLANLLVNARTYTPPGTHIRVALRTDATTCVLEVQDDGPGVAPEIADRTFERFVHGADNRSASSGSSGLGLSIVDAIVRAHGGSVSLESRPGATRFWITLPLARDESIRWRSGPDRV